MPRRLRHTPAGLTFHALNRANRRMRLFFDDGELGLEASWRERVRPRKEAVK